MFKTNLNNLIPKPNTLYKLDSLFLFYYTQATEKILLNKQTSHDDCGGGGGCSTADV